MDMIINFMEFIHNIPIEVRVQNTKTKERFNVKLIFN